MNTEKYMRLLLAAIAVAIMAACASIGRPDGGPRDKYPPVYMGSKPEPGALHVKDNRVTITFDENVQLEDASNKVVVSPAQKQMPQISSQGKNITVELRDTMLPNTTYTIDFSDAIRDLNESNVLDGFAVDFSTGDAIDTLQISGMVFEARNLEPAQGIVVGVYSDLADSALTTKQFERIAKTNSLGQFTVRNLKPGTYRIYAVNDVNRDYKWDRSEDIAFYDTTIVPSARPTVIADTLKNAAGEDSIVEHGATMFLPNDVLLAWFNEKYLAQYLKNYARPERGKLSLEFGAPSDSLPRLTLLNHPDGPRPIEKWTVLDASATRDTLQYWITDTTIAAMDTLRIAAQYLKTDSTDALTWTADTLRFTFKAPKKKDNKKEEKKKKKKDNDTTAVDSLPQIEFLQFSAASSTNHNIYAPLVFKGTEPIDTILESAMHLEIQKDTLWIPDSIPPLRRDLEHHPLFTYKTSRKWEPGAKYRFTIDSAAITGVDGKWNQPVVHEFTVRKLEDYAALFFKMAGVSQPAVVELLDAKDDTVRTARVENGEAAFMYIDPGTYYARMYIDANNNGRYDSGDIKTHRQPEEVYYYPRKIVLKKNWDLEQSWNINDLPIDRQKPEEIKKNKPEKRKNWDEEDKKDSRQQDEEYDPYNDVDYGFGSSGYNNYNNYNGGRY